MADNDAHEPDETSQGGSGRSGAKIAMTAAAAAAVTGAAAVAARKTLSGSGSGNGKSHNGSAAPATVDRGSSSTLLTSIATGGWDAARDALVPLAEDAAGAAGTYLAKNAPELVKDTILPRFISSFNEARKEG